MNSKRLTFLIFLLFVALGSRGQTQLVLLNHEKVLARFAEGQAFSYKLKKSKDFVIGYIVKVREFSVITSYDTIQFSAIDRISLRGGNAYRYERSSFLGYLGSTLLYAGILYFAIDELNSSVVHGQGFDNDKAVWEPAAVMVASGLILKSIRKKSQRLRYPAKLLAAPRGSSFWRPD